MTSRINWAIQSSGVDYLHLLIVGMDYLTRRFNLNCRLAITVHDEIRYLVKEEDKYRVAMALQVANVWTRAIFSQQLGINELPQSCAFFSAVDIDHVLRKEVDMDCVTPSHPDKISHGESLDIGTLLNKGTLARLDPAIVPEIPPQLEKYAGMYTPRIPVMAAVNTSAPSLAYLKAQITADDKELRDIVRDSRPPKAYTPRKTKKSAEDNAMEHWMNSRSFQEQSARLMPVDEPWTAHKFSKSWDGKRNAGWHQLTNQGHAAGSRFAGRA